MAHVAEYYGKNQNDGDDAERPTGWQNEGRCDVRMDLGFGAD